MSARPTPQKKSARTPTTTRAPLIGADHHLLMLLSVIDGCQEYDAAMLARYQLLARQILASPNAFDEGNDTLSVADCVLRATPSRDAAEHERLIEQIKRLDREPVTAKAEDLRAMLYSVISDSTLYGAALMFELLKGGAR